MSRRRDGSLGLGGPSPIRDPRPKAPHPLRTTLIALAVLGLAVLWARYAPLEAGPPTTCPPDAEEIGTGQLTMTDMEEFGDRSGLCLIRNVNTTRTTITTVIRNDGPIGARLTGARLSGVADLFDVEAIAVGRSQAPLDPEQAEPLEGSVLVPRHSERVVTMTVSLPPCDQVERPRVATFSELPLRARVLGLPRDVDLPLDPVLRMQSEACPR